MVKYPEDANFVVPSITGGQVSGQSLRSSLIPWQPSTWPPAPRRFDSTFHGTLNAIFRESMVDELQNVVQDIQSANSGAAPFAHRGHVVAVACMCALDAVSLYGYKNRNVKKFIRNHFPAEYRPYASRIYPEYRHNLVHAWNLFGNAALLPGNEPISEQGGHVSFGILNFVHAFEGAVSDFLTRLETDTTLQERALYRYREVIGEIEVTRSERSLVPVAAGFALGIGAALVFEVLRRR